jgi:hypothetical protein
MSDQPPLDLRALADVDAPEVIHEALRRFRRKILARSVWVVVLAGVAVVVVVWVRTPTTLAERVDQASRTIEAHPVWHAHGATVALDRVASLGDGRLGFHFVVIGKGLVTLRMSGQVATENVGWWNKYVEIERPVHGYPTLTIVGGEGRSSFSLGPGSGVTQAVWSL